MEPSVNEVFDQAVDRTDLVKQSIGRNEIRKARLAAQRYGIVPELYERIRDNYSILFEGRQSPAYEKSALYYIIRVFQGGYRLEPDAKVLEDGKVGVNIFVRRAAFEQIVDDKSKQPTYALAESLRRLKSRKLRCRFWTFGFSPEDTDERIREFFPGSDGLVSFSMSAILADLVRSSMEERSADDKDKEEGQLTQGEKIIPPSILCHTADHLFDNWRVSLHPWIQNGFKLLADHLEPVCELST